MPSVNNIGRFGYTGQMWLKEAEVYHYKARAYDPYIGRFLQTDPIGYGDGMNSQAYVGGDPVNFTDPTGLSAFEQRCRTWGTSIVGSPGVRRGITCSPIPHYWAPEPAIDPNPSEPGIDGNECPALKPNGCGAKGDWKSHFIPNKPQNFDFTEACNNHDINFGTLGFGFEKANEQFLRDMLAVPDQKRYVFSKTGNLSSITITSESWAQTYYNAVSGKAGKRAYEAAQKLAKACQGE